MIPNKYIIISLFGVFLSLASSGQNLTNSPSSIYGLGEIELGEYGRNAGMSGVGIGYRANDFLNNINPAALSAIDSLSFFFDVSIAGDIRKYEYMNKIQVTPSGNFRKISLGFRASPRWAMSAGLVPFTSVGYKILTTQFIEGTLDNITNSTFEGSGGINKYYLSNSYRISPKISIGATVSLLAGNMSQKETYSLWTVNKISKVAKLYVDFGMQYTDHFSDKLNYTIGAIYGYKSSLPLTNKILTINDGGETIQDETTTTTNQYVPESYGLGLSLNWKQKLTMAADYRYQKWSAVSSNFASVKFTDMHKANIGFEYIPNKNIPKTYMQIMRYRAGFSINNSYLTINNQNPLNYAASAGIGFPLKTGSIINCSFEYGISNSTGISTIKESYGRFTLSLTLRETWFLKSKFD